MSAICSHQSHQMPHFPAKMHQIQFRWGSLQLSPDPLAGGEGANCPIPKNPHPIHLPVLVSSKNFNSFASCLNSYKHYNYKFVQNVVIFIVG